MLSEIIVSVILVSLVVFVLIFSREAPVEPPTLVPPSPWVWVNFDGVSASSVTPRGTTTLTAVYQSVTYVVTYVTDAQEVVSVTPPYLGEVKIVPYGVIQPCTTYRFTTTPNTKSIPACVGTTCEVVASGREEKYCVPGQPNDPVPCFSRGLISVERRTRVCTGTCRSSSGAVPSGTIDSYNGVCEGSCRIPHSKIELVKGLLTYYITSTPSISAGGVEYGIFRFNLLPSSLSCSSQGSYIQFTYQGQYLTVIDPSTLGFSSTPSSWILFTPKLVEGVYVSSGTSTAVKAIDLETSIADLRDSLPSSDPAKEQLSLILASDVSSIQSILLSSYKVFFPGVPVNDVIVNLVLAFDEIKDRFGGGSDPNNLSQAVSDFINEIEPAASSGSVLVFLDSPIESLTPEGYWTWLTTPGRLFLSGDQITEFSNISLEQLSVNFTST